MFHLAQANFHHWGRGANERHARVVLGKGPDAVLQQTAGQNGHRAIGDDPQCSRIGCASGDGVQVFLIVHYETLYLAS